MLIIRCRRLAMFSLLAVFLICKPATAGVTGSFVRVENPTGWGMGWNEIEVFAGETNLVAKRPELFSGTIWPDHDMRTRDGREMTDGLKDTTKRGPDFVAKTEPRGMNPWFEVALDKPATIDRIVLYGSQYPQKYYLDKGHRVVSVLDADRRVVWSNKFDYYDQTKFRGGVFELSVADDPKLPVLGKRIPDRAVAWVPMQWLLEADSIAPLPDAAARMKRFEQRNSADEIERLSRRFFPLVDRSTPGLENAFALFDEGKHGAALEAWKEFWFAKMARVNLHWAMRDETWIYPSNGDDLLSGVAVTISATSARAIRYTPGQIAWVDLPPSDSPAFRNALTDAQEKAVVNKVSRPLVHAYRRLPNPAYLRRWAEIMDDWSLNYFADAAKSPYEVENLFTFAPALDWIAMMEDLGDMAQAQPESVALIPAATLARVQMICLEKYSTAWWRQARETVFNHLNGGIFIWDPISQYVTEFHAGQRTRQEWRHAFERFITLGTQRDGSLTEIGDEGHQEMSVQLGPSLTHYEQTKPDWYTPGWRNRVFEWYDNMFKYMLRHLSPGGYEHRFAVDYRPSRWTSTHKQYNLDRLHLPKTIDRDAAVLGIPEVRRILDAIGNISSGMPTSSDPVWRPALEAQQRSHDAVAEFLGDEKPGLPHINSDWMPYTGAYYFRGGWKSHDAFMGMMACGSDGGSQAPQWPYSMLYHYDYNYPLVAQRPVHVDGLPPQQLFGRMHCYEPGTKTMALTNAEEKPALHRWLSNSRYDYGEAIFNGGYQNYPGFKGSEYTLQQAPLGPSVANVHAVRQVIQLRGSRLFIVTDSVQTPGSLEHDLSVTFNVALSSRDKPTATVMSERQLQIDKQGRVVSNNPDGPSVALHHFASRPFGYEQPPLNNSRVDYAKYAKRLTSGIRIVEQPVVLKSRGNRLNLVSVISSRDVGAEDRIASIAKLAPASDSEGLELTGFEAKLRDGGTIGYQHALAKTQIRLDRVIATATTVLVVRDQSGLSGIVLGAEAVKIDGQSIDVKKHADFEFATVDGRLTITPIFQPIDPVRFEPGHNVFVDQKTVKLVSDTPGVEIRYTTDGTPPTRDSQLYTGPITIRETTEFAARAYRLGDDGKPLPADDFEINGVKFTVPSYGVFTKQVLQPAVATLPKNLQPGLNYDYLEAPWWSLYANGHWLPAAGGGTVEREMDLTKVATDDHYGMRYHGYLKIPRSGVYTFHGPEELAYMNDAPSYDLRVFIDGREWYLTEWWHGHGAWSIPLEEGFHKFEVDFADARTKPWRRSGIWRYYPRPWAVRQGKPSDIQISGPGHIAGIGQKGRIPAGWLYHVPQARSFADERVLVDANNGLRCGWDGAVDVAAANLHRLCFQSSGKPSEVFAKLIFETAAGDKKPFAEIAASGRQTPGGLIVDLRGGFDKISGVIDTAPAREAKIVAEYIAADGKRAADEATVLGSERP